MPAASDRTEFAPPPQPGLMRGLAVAVLAHLLLLVALTFGVQWKREAENLSAEAELWSSLPQQAAPKEEQPVVPTPPVVQPPPPAPEPVVKAPPEPPVVKPPPEPPARKDAEIALEREKQRKLAEAEARREELERQREKQQKLEEARKKEEARKQKQREALEAAEARRKEEDKRKRLEQEQESRRVAQQREANLRRLQAQAGTGDPSATGAAARSSGPSDSWAGRIRARVKPNIVFGDDIAGNPVAEVEVRMAPDGTITSKRLVKSSGNRLWDEAVLRALDKTEVLPRDVDGRVHSPVVIEFRPKG
jgi:colicin import membrane protein